MAVRKRAAKSGGKNAVRTSAKAHAKLRSNAAGPAGRQRKAAARPPVAAAAPVQQNGRHNAGTGLRIRVRMYRIGFGDFFLVTVPGNDGPAHILIDCGVHAKDLDSMDACIQDLKKTTNNRLALVILTHYHADHMSGFASHYDDFANLDHVGAVWITNRLDPNNTAASKFMAQITSVAQQLQLRLGAREDTGEATHKVFNALGVEPGAASPDGGANAKALKLLQQGFKSNPPVYYYQGGDVPKLPTELEGKITAEILAPSPKDAGEEFASSDNKQEQYLATAGDNGVPDVDRVRPFEKRWPASAADYPMGAFDEFDSGLIERGQKRKNDGVAAMEATLADMQPDVLAAAADKLDGTLNNQSLVVFFTCQGKKLLFVGDAQWGNWSYWLYGQAVTGADPGITARARDILGSIDFYKVGHHGSTNATPIPVVSALNSKCAAMCSTATGVYGNPEKKTEVPRTALMDALEKRTGDQLIRSDWVAAGQTAPDPDAKKELPTLPAEFSTPGQLYIDFML